MQGGGINLLQGRCVSRSLAYLRLPFAALAGFLLYFEVPDAFTVLGALIVFASVSYITALESRAKRGKG